MKGKWKFRSSGIAALLVFVIILAGCSSTSQKSGETSPAASATSSATTGAETPTATNLDPYDLTMAFFTISSQTKGIPAVQDELNKILKAKINTTVTLLPIPYASYPQQINLMNASNEKLDLLISGVKGSYSSQVATGQLLPISDLLAKYGSGIQTALGNEIINATKINGQSYSVPSNRDLSGDVGIVMRKDMVDKYKIDTTKIKTLEDLDAVFKVIKENEPNMTPVVKYQSSATGPRSLLQGIFDSLGDSMGVLPYADDSMKVVNLYETKEYTSMMQTFRKWNLAGYINKDAATSKDSGNDLVKADRAFSFFTTLKPGYEGQATRTIGKEMVAVRLSKNYTKTASVTGFMWGISKSSKNPERAMMLLNLMYTDKDINNLLGWGIEGKDYVKTTNNQIDYPPGITASTVDYGLNLGWNFGNQFLSYVFATDPPDLWTQLDAFNKSSIKSKALGFTFDATSVKTEVAAVTSVITQYQTGIETGTLDPDKLLPEFNTKLKSAGIDKIIAEKQKQLDAWAKTKS